MKRSAVGNLEDIAARSVRVRSVISSAMRFAYEGSIDYPHSNAD